MRMRIASAESPYVDATLCIRELRGLRSEFSANKKGDQPGSPFRFLLPWVKFFGHGKLG